MALGIFGNHIDTTGSIILKPSTTSRTVGIGDSATGDFNLTAGEITGALANYSELIIGASGNTGAVDINDITFEGDTTIYGGAMALETITTADFDLTLDSTGNITDAIADTTDNFDLGSGGLTITGLIIGATGDGYIDVNTTGTISTVSSNGDTYINSKGASTDLGTSSASGSFRGLYIISSGSITQSGVLTAPLIKAISTGGDVILNTQSNAFSLILPSSAAGDFLLDNGNTNLLFGGGIDTSDSNGAISLDLGTGKLDMNNLPIRAGSGDVTLIADTIYLGPITTTGDIVLKPTTASRTVGIGDDATGDFDLDVVEIAALTAGYNSLTIGADGNTGAVDINDITFEGDTTIYGGAMAVETITTSDFAVTLEAENTITDARMNTTDNFFLGSGDLTLISNSGNIGAFVNPLDIYTTGTLSLSSAAGAAYMNFKAGTTMLGTTDAGSLLYFSSLGDVIQNGGISADLLYVASGGGDIDFSTQENAIAGLFSLTTDGDFLLNNGDNSFGISGTLSTFNSDGDITIDVGTGSLSTGGNFIFSGSGGITFIADSVNLGTTANRIFSTGDIVLKPTTTTRTVGIGDSATGNFDLDVAEIAALAAGYSSLTIGASGNTGAVDINDITFEGATTIYGGNMTVDSISLDGADLALNSTGTITQSANDTIATTTSGNIHLTSEGSSTLTTVTSAGDLRLSKRTSSATYTCDGYTLTAPGALTIDEGVTLDLGGSDTAIDNTLGSFANNGTLRLEGDEVLTGLTNDTDSGTVVYDGPGSYTTLVLGNTYYNLTFSGPGTWTLDTPYTVNGTFSAASGAVDISSYIEHAVQETNNTIVTTEKVFALSRLEGSAGERGGVGTIPDAAVETGTANNTNEAEDGLGPQQDMQDDEQKGSTGGGNTNDNDENDDEENEEDKEGQKNLLISWFNLPIFGARPEPAVF